MARRRRDKFDRHLGNAQFVAEFLRVLGFVDLMATAVGIPILLAWRAGGDKPIDMPFVAWLIGGFVIGVTLGGLLLGLGTVLRYGHFVAKAHDRAEHDRGAGDPRAAFALPGATRVVDHTVRTAGLDGDATTNAQTLAVLRQIRDLALIDPHQRDVAHERIVAHMRRSAARDVVDAINMRRIAMARSRLAEAVASLGATSVFDELGERIKQAASRQEPLDHARTKRLVEESIADGRWAAAEQYAHALFDDHPDSARGRQLWDDTRRARLQAVVAESAAGHHWIEALAAAREFLDRFPDAVEAGSLRDQLDTLRANADIATRKQYETKFMELVSTRNFTDALRLAKRVIEQFPDSPQAAALRAQIPALEQRLRTGSGS